MQRYRLLREMQEIDTADALTDLIDANWEIIKNNFTEGFVVEDMKPGVKFSVFAIYWRYEFNGFELFSICPT